jgi:hypothetical protein
LGPLTRSCFQLDEAKGIKESPLLFQNYFFNQKSLLTMKNILFIALFLTFFTACQNATTPKTDAAETAKPAPTTAVELKTDTTHVHVFACPMDPEITGKEGDKCSKCGMALVHKN